MRLHTDITCITFRITLSPLTVIRSVIQSVITPEAHVCFMAPILTARISEGMKSEIETLVEDTGLWASRTEFVKTALDEKIRKHWRGERYAQRTGPTEHEEGQ